MNTSMPVGVPKTTEKLMFSSDDTLLPGFYEVLVESVGKGLVYTKAGSSKLSAFTGFKRLSLTSAEIEEFTKLGEIRILKVYKGIYYENYSNIFSNYIAKWFNIKKVTPKSDPLRNIAKLFLNSF